MVSPAQEVHCRETSYLTTGLSSSTRQSRWSSRSRGTTLSNSSRRSLLSGLTLKKSQRGQHCA